jgi:ferrous iron transport protein B
MKIALVGNPNTGKSSVFNLLTGLRQHVGNFPGVTVDKKVGTVTIAGESHTVVDLPGTYSIYPRSADEQVVYNTLSNPTNPDYPDAVVVVADASNLERNLFLFSQVYDLSIPCVLVLNMTDIAQRKGISIDQQQLETTFPGASIVAMNARVGLGKDRLIQSLNDLFTKGSENWRAFLPEHHLAPIEDLKDQEQEAEARYAKITKLMPSLVRIQPVERKSVGSIDRWLVHPVFGYLIFAVILLIIFQFIFAFASVPMDFIDASFTELSGWISNQLPSGVLSDLISQGIIPGIGGVVVFVPQIALLFFFIALLEESGYLARVVFIMDRLMRPLGLNGKSVVPLLSSVACAIPGIMATRTIADWKERIITIMVAPLMSCSARIPVYTLLIALVIPNERVLGVLNIQGLVLFGLYSLGLVSALVVAAIMKGLIRSKDRGFLLLELPSYKRPQWKNVGITVLEKVRVFVTDAGKVILAISIILWALASYGPGDSMSQATVSAEKKAKTLGLSLDETGQLVASEQLEKSYMGHLGKAIEPIIQPIGYDWKIGISLITSFAAREVFVGSLATIYAVQEEGEENKRLIDRLRAEKNADGSPVYSLASGVSLMIFYVYAMQCMATLAVVKRETKSWKWPIIQVAFMGVLAYLGALLAFNLLS